VVPRTSECVVVSLLFFFLANAERPKLKRLSLRSTPKKRRHHSNIRGNVRSSGGQNDGINSLGPTVITQTYYARSSASSGSWLNNSRRGRNT